jgi:hypothetical protein
MTRERMREILADELSKQPNAQAPAHLIERIRDGSHGPAIHRTLDAMKRAIDEALKET